MAAPEWPTARQPLVASAFWRACQAAGRARADRRLDRQRHRHGTIKPTILKLLFYPI